IIIMIIAISKASGSEKYRKYATWLCGEREDVQVVDCSVLTDDGMREVMAGCHGLLLSGGADVEPSRYGCEAGDLPCAPDPERDARELAMLDIALERAMPVLGICRGMQVLNVHGGGTLIIDIPRQVTTSARPVAHAGTETGTDADVMHAVDLASDSVLKKLVRRSTGMVNSSHHQAVDILAPGYTVAATADDGVIEAIERDPEHGRSVVLGVQWHPERMDHDQPLSKNIRHYFLFECDCYAEMGSGRA
ncbi:MAG: gamma-glutamyl-gamma-aminobutyrate hydrolase family protein, partial [Candidatus Kapaibacterium sp.]